MLLRDAWLPLGIVLIVVGLVAGNGPLAGLGLFVLLAGFLARQWADRALDRRGVPSRDAGAARLPRRQPAPDVSTDQPQSSSRCRSSTCATTCRSSSRRQSCTFRHPASRARTSTSARRTSAGTRARRGRSTCRAPSAGTIASAPRACAPATASACSRTSARSAR